MILPVNNFNPQCNRKIAFGELEDIGGGAIIAEPEPKFSMAQAMTYCQLEEERMNKFPQNKFPQEIANEVSSKNILARIKNAIKLIK